MHTRNKIFKNALILSVLLHSIALFVLDRNLKFSFLEAVESLPVLSVSLAAPPVIGEPETIGPERISEDLPAPQIPVPAIQKVETAPQNDKPVESDRGPVVDEIKADEQGREPVMAENAPVLQNDGFAESGIDPTRQGEEFVSQEYEPVESAGFTGQKLDSLDFSGRAQMPPPSYPSQAKRMEWEGDVTVSFVINKKGKVESLILEKSSGHELLDKAVLNTVKKGWRFPRREESVQVWKTFSFRLI